MNRVDKIKTTTEAQERRTQYEKRRDYFNEYRRRNPERVKRWKENYILNKAERIKAQRNDTPTDGQEGP